MAIYNAASGLYIETCCRCKTKFGISSELYIAATERRGPNGIQFYCPHGHTLHYVEGETDAEKLRRERDRLAQEVAYQDDMRRKERERGDAFKRSARAYKGAATRLKNRAKAGVCPCCNRTFQNLARHMKSQHPDRQTDNVVELGQATK